MFKRAELPREALRELRDHCREAGVAFFSTPTSVEGLADLVELEVPLLKNGSDYLLHLPLVRAMAQTGIQTVLSTGMASMGEIVEAVDAFYEAGGRDLVLLSCTSSYPTPPDQVNLLKIPALAAAFGCPIGLSDHTDGALAAAAAVALGGCFVEKHFTLDRGAAGPDHRFSADPAGLVALVEQVRQVEQMLGSGDIVPTDAEVAVRDDYRLSCAAARHLPEGLVLAAGDIVFRRPGGGLPPGGVDQLIGRRLRHPVAAGTPLSEADVT
jgi:N,N'-diacetyllegionaminate synthase